MIAALQQFLAWIHLHPHWALLLLLLAALLDSVFLIGAFVPAGVALFAAGALVALGSLELWEAILAAALGAIAGDVFSFWLGRRYGERLFAWRPLRRHPELVLNGRRFFQRHGAWSVALARFLGPMRAIVPALAGASGLRTPAFLLADIGSATAWAFAFVLPGVAFGASLGLAAEVAGRLALLLLGVIIALILTVWITLLIGRAAQRHASAWIGAWLDWSQRHRRLGKFGPALADPAQPETPALALLAVLLLLISGIGLWLWAGTALHTYPWAFDAAVFQSMRDLHSPWGWALAQRLDQIGQWIVYGPVALVTFAGLLGLRQKRAAAHWAAAICFGAALSVGLHAVPTLPPPHVYFGTPAPSAQHTRDLVLVTVIYSFLPVLLATGRSPLLGRLLYASAMSIILLVVLARLYTGTQWASIALFSVLVGAVWSAMLGLGYRRHQPQRLPVRRVLAPSLIAFIASVAFAWATPHAVAPNPPLTVHRVGAAEWMATAWQELPRHRIDIAGRNQQALTLQWAADLTHIKAALAATGWEPPPPLSGSSALRWLGRSLPIAELPILPQVHAGHHPVLSLRRIVDEEQAELIRLWPSTLALDDGRPIWLGTITRIQARTMYRVLRYPATTLLAVDPAVALADVAGLQIAPRPNVWLLSFADTSDATAAAPPGRLQTPTHD